MIDVTLQNFEAEVIAASMETPVLVDFWAPWCAPCKSLGPILEQLEVEFAGRFKLVKIDSDQEQQLAQAFGIQSIPTCVLLVGGKPVDGFMGAMPAGKVREFLNKNVPSEEEIAAEIDTEEAEALIEQGNPAAALEKLGEALAINPANDDARFDYVKLLVQHGQLAPAQAALAPTLTRIPVSLRFTALSQWINALEFAANYQDLKGAIAQFDSKIAENKRDFDSRFAKARVLMARNEWTAALDELLEIILRDKKWGDEAPRKAVVAILELLTPPPPKAGAAAVGKTAGGIELMGKSAVQEDPQAALVSTYRRRLSMMLN